jgi:hypothetical protein
MKANPSLRVLVLTAVAAYGLPVAAAQGPLKAQTKAAEEVAAPARPDMQECPADDSVGRAGLRAFIDPQTGQLREPTPQEAQALSRAAQEAFARAVESLEAVVHPDGTISVDLKSLFMQDLVAVKDSEGSLSVHCVPDSEKPLAVAEPAPRRPALEEQ